MKRTFDPVSPGEADEVLDGILDDPMFIDFLKKVLTGERQPEEIPSEFQAYAEAIHITMTDPIALRDQIAAADGDMRAKGEKESA